MKGILLVLFSLSSSYAAELIYISNDSVLTNLETLSDKYKQPLLINDSHVYLIPKECQLTRYFGGASQDHVKLIEGPEQTQNIAMTQEIFEAKDKVVIQEKVEIEKSIALIEGKVSKAFLDDQDGRGFGGASEVPLDFTFQKMAAKKEHMKPEQEPKTIVQSAPLYQHPKCELLKDGSGYRLENAKESLFYSNKVLIPIINQTIFFH